VATYYVDTNAAAGGNGTTSGLTGANCAWDTIADVNAATFAVGDSVLFKCGCTWREELIVPSAGSAGHLITFGSYGTGDKPKIYGSDVPSSWTQEDYVATPTLSKVQGATSAYAGSSVSKDYTDTPTEGNLLVAVGFGTTVVANASIDGWTKATDALMGATASLAIFYKVAGAGESKTVTLVWTSSTSTKICIEEWSGFIAPVLDKTAFTNNTGAGTSRTSGTTAETTHLYEILIAGFGHGNTISDRSYSNSFTEDYDIGSSNIWQVASRTVSAKAAYETTQSWTTSRVSGACIATFGGTETARCLYYTDQSADPLYIWFIGTNGVIHNGVKAASKNDLIAEYDWWFDDPNNRLYIYAATDPLTRYSSVEVSSLTRDRGITWSIGHNYEYISVDGFEVAFITGNGIVVRGHSQIVNNHVHHLGLKATGHGYGTEINGGSYGLIANNIIHDVYRSGIYLIPDADPHSTYNVIEYNTVYDCDETAIRIHTNELSSESSNNIIRYNNLYNTSGFVSRASFSYGIWIRGISGVPADLVQVYYNRISVIKTAIAIDDYTTNAAIYNNSILSTTSKGIYVSGTGTSGIIIENNIVADAGLYGLQVVDKTKITTCDYNTWYAPSGTSYANINATNYGVSDFAAYKTATGWDAHGLWQDPLITSAATPDFHLLSTSPCINAGTNVGLTTDYEGNTVPVGAAQDIGAYEFQATLLIAAEGAQAQVSDAPALTGTHILIAVEGAQAQVSDAPALSQEHHLAAIEGAQVQASDTPSLTQAHILAAADGLQTQVSDNNSLLVTHILAVQEANQPQISDVVVLAGATVNLVAEEGTQPQTSEEAAIDRIFVLVSEENRQDQLSDAANVFITFQLAIREGYQTEFSDIPALTQLHKLITQEGNQTSESDLARVVTDWVKIGLNSRTAKSTTGTSGIAKSITGTSGIAKSITGTSRIRG